MPGVEDWIAELSGVGEAPGISQCSPEPAVRVKDSAEMIVSHEALVIFADRPPQSKMKLRICQDGRQGLHGDGVVEDIPVKDLTIKNYWWLGSVAMTTGW
jgi:hypothetical protein